MYAVKFQAPITKGMVQIPKRYRQLQENTRATFVVMYENDTDRRLDTQANIDEFERLVSQSDNKKTATMSIATNIDDMVLDGIL